jgi:SPP1 gp7 family putative phage head morphogenesis protein
MAGAKAAAKIEKHGFTALDKMFEDLETQAVDAIMQGKESPPEPNFTPLLLEVIYMAMQAGFEVEPRLPNNTARMAAGKAAKLPIKIPTNPKELRIWWDLVRHFKAPPKIQKLADKIKQAYLNKVQSIWVEIGKDFREGAIWDQKVIRQEMKKIVAVVRSRARTIVATETTRYFNTARINYYDKQPTVTHYLFIAIRDHRTTEWCKTRQGLVYEKGSEIFKKEKPPAHWNCYDKNTEIYTDKGFVLFPEITKEHKILSLNPNTRDLLWTEIEAIQKYYHKGIMKHLTNAQTSLDMMVTPEHNMFIYKRVDHGRERTIEPLFIRLNEIKCFKEAKLYLSSKWKGREIDSIDLNGCQLTSKQFCRFMGFYLSDGSTRSTGNGSGSKYAHIAQQKGQDLMFNELREFPFNNVTVTKEKVNIYDTRIGQYCAQFGHSQEKFVPTIVKEMTPELIREFLNAFNQCDGYIQPPKEGFKDIKFAPMKRYFTTSKRMADDIVELLIKSGTACRVFLRKDAGKIIKFKNGNYKINYDLYCINEITSEYRVPLIINDVEYEDYVYDVTLKDNHTLLTRRNGRIVWGSNCRSEVTPLVPFNPRHKALIDDPERQRKNKKIGKSKGQVWPLPEGWNE